MKKPLTIVKLGGSIITDKSKPYTPNLKAIEDLIKQIKKSEVPVVIIHGAGSYAHTSAKKYGGKRGYKSLLGVATVSYDAQTLNQLILGQLIKAKIPAMTFRPNSLFLSSGGKMEKSLLEPVFEAIKQGIVPVLYGDAIMDTLWKTTIFSGETSTHYLAKDLIESGIKIEKIIQVGTTDGVYDSTGATIPTISKESFSKIKSDITASLNVDVTGGMMHKVERALDMSQTGVPTYIINGLVKNNLLKVLKNEHVKSTIIK